MGKSGRNSKNAKEENVETEKKLASTAASFLGKQMEL